VATIRVRRDTRFYARARALSVLVDGEEAGKVRHGESCDIEVPAGVHEVQMKLDWGTSPPLEVSAADGAPVRLLAGVSTGLIGATFKAIRSPKSLYTLEPDPSPASGA